MASEALPANHIEDVSPSTIRRKYPYDGRAMRVGVGGAIEYLDSPASLTFDKPMIMLNGELVELTKAIRDSLPKDPAWAVPDGYKTVTVEGD